MEATPETAYLTHVRLGQLRWMAGVMAPREFRVKMVEPPAPAEPLTVLVHLRQRARSGDGEDEGVSLCPNPVTGEMERTDVAGWRPTQVDAVVMPSGTGQ